MAVLDWLENTGVSTWIREADTVWAFPTILTLHTIGLGLLVGVAAIVNLRLLDVNSPVPLAPLRPLFTAMWAGFFLNVTTGSLLFLADATSKGTNKLFLLKLVLVGIGVATIVLIQRAVFDSDAEEPEAMRRTKVLAVVSLAAWVGAVTAGRLLAYV